MGVEEINSFHMHLAVDEKVVASAQQQVLSVLLFPWEIPKLDLDLNFDIVRTKRSRYLPTV